MTDQTPIERAAQAIKREAGGEADDVWTGEALAAFDSIDVDQLAGVLRSQIIGENTLAHSVRIEIALAVKNWLTGKDTQ